MATGRIVLSGGGSLNVQSVSDLIDNAGVKSNAAIEYSKLRHLHTKEYSQPNTAATSETRILHVAKGAGTILGFRAGSIVIAVGTSSVTLDLKKNGTTCLSSVITLDSGNTAYSVEDGTLSVTTYAAGDVFTVVLAATFASPGSLPTGTFCQAQFAEDAA